MDKILNAGIKQVINQYKTITNLECYYYKLSTGGEADKEFCSESVFCQFVQKSKAGTNNCCSRLADTVRSAVSDNTYKINVCHFGLQDVIVPVFYNGAAVGYFISTAICDSSETKVTIVEQNEFFAEQFKISFEELEKLISTIAVVDTSQVHSFGQLLLSLCRIYIPTGKTTETKFAAPKLDELFNEEETPLETLPKDLPLSTLIYQESINSKAPQIFWKTVETRAGNVYANLISKRVLKAHIEYNEIMKLAYNEPELELAKVSAEMLFHIIILTRFSRELFDIRFYRLTFDTMRQMFAATDVNQVKTIMENTFNAMASYCVSNTVSSKQNHIVEKIMEFIDQNYHLNIKVDDVAKHVHMSQEYISRVFKRETSCTIKWYLTNLRMQHAQTLLQQTDMPIKDICYAVGYGDVRSFYKAFSKHFGITCSEMRKSFPSK